MNEERDTGARLRTKFPAESVGKLPKPYKKDNPKGTCPECGGWHGLPAMHLDYVGHAAVTDRLLSVDPEWTWEPAGTTDHGLPMFDAEGGLWIKLTVCGVTRYGYGDGPDPKQCISDAIRNAAMRFGVALDLWSREELESSTQTSATGSTSPGGEAPAGPARLGPDEEPVADTTPPVASPEASPVAAAGGEAAGKPSDPPAAPGDYEGPATEEQWGIARQHIGSVPTILGKYQLKFGSRKKKDEVTKLELAELIEDALKKVPTT